MGSQDWTGREKTYNQHTGKMMGKAAVITLYMFSTAFAQNNNRLQSLSREDKQDVDVVEPEELSLFARLVGEDTQARVIESISSWANDKAKENPGCVERF